MSKRPQISLAELSNDPDRGLECPRCGCRHFWTRETRPREGGYIYRRKSCRHCGENITTTERMVGGV